MELKARCKERFEPVVQAIRQLQKEKEGLDEPLIVAIDGRCGSGKTTFGKLIAGLEKSTNGKFWFQGQEMQNFSEKQFRPYRRNLQMIFQSSSGVFDPGYTIGENILEILKLHEKLQEGEYEERVKEALIQTGLDPDIRNRYVGQISGGQCQRANIARALVLRPELVICDEPVSALDVSIQAQVLNLMKEIQKELNLTYLFIAHDLSVVQYMSDRIMVMYLGKIVEVADSKALYDEPLHPYTKALLSAIPVADIHHKKKRQVLEGEVPSPIHKPSGCAFHNRCPYCMDICKKEDPVLRYHGADGHMTACHLYDGSEVKA